MARTKSAKLAAKRRQTAAGLASIGIMQDHARHQREPRTRPDDPQRVVKAARTRQIAAPKGDLLHPMYGCLCGIAIDALAEDWAEAEALWRVWHDMDRAHGLYCSRVLEVRRHPATGRVDLVHERIEAGPNDPAPDTRDADERHRDAVNAWHLWQVRIARLSEAQRTALMGTMWGRIDPVRNGRVLRAGVLMVDAVRVLRGECDAGC